ncbi:prolyl oligopeptidase family serine peptidase [Caulobacter segnis]|uniref:S9 family peptidase n=1 Tax=Caulobacter segnis TaxID=88688 RepID=A0A2W5V2K2_9CAUL|nr:prolyl oligopeptidase family serine peptidase [Caulobacter segnis]PZR34100.1 MAG: S9 family peptidase [Caulobacter segnis]
MRSCAWLALACGLATAAPAAPATPFTVEALLSLEEIGRAAFSPDGRWFVFERHPAWKSAPRFDQDFMVGSAASQLMVVDLKAPGPARPLLVAEAGSGDAMGAFSPDGARIIVVRQRGHARELGVVTVATGAVAWSGRLVEPELWFAQARWRDNNEVVAMSRPPEAIARLSGLGWQGRERVSKAWAASAEGKLSVTALGSGRFTAMNPPASQAALVAFNVVTGRSRVLAHGAFADLLLAPGGRTAAVLEEAERTEPTAQSLIRVGYPPRRLRLVMVDLTTGARRTPCPRCDLVRGAWAWSPRGEALAVAARPDGDGWADYRYWRLPVVGQPTVLAPGLTLADTGGRDPRPLPAIAWPDKDPLVLAREGEAARRDWWRLGRGAPVRLTRDSPEPQGPALVSANKGLALRSAEGLRWLDPSGRLGARLAGPDAVVKAPIDPLPGLPRSAGLVFDAGTHRLLTSGGVLSRPLQLPERAQILALSETWGGVAALSTDAHGVGSLVLVRPDEAVREVATVNAELAKTAFANPAPVMHRAMNGAPLTSWLYLPPQVPPNGPKGLIVTPYPGARYARPPSAAEPGARSFDANVQLMAAAGYAVIVPSLPMERDRDPMPGLADAMLLAVDAAVAANPILRDRPLAVWGQSYGGYGALAAGVESSRFGAIIASAPITNLLSYYGAIHPEALASPELMTLPSELGWAEHGQGQMGGPPWLAPDKYLRNSPGLQSDKINAPVMLIYGDLDTDLGQVTTLFSSLYRQGKDAQLLLYRGESHVVLSPDNVRDLYRRAFAFLDTALSHPSPLNAARPAEAESLIRPSQ